MTDARRLARSFGQAADTYEEGRPGYTAAAAEWLLAPTGAAGARVADVGAGTGKLTRTLLATGAQVVAVEPDPAMRAVLHEALPDVPTFAGTAERLPLPDAGLDAIVVGQAWHWVDPVAAAAEAARVLRPGGVLGLVWNLRDEAVPWVARLTEIMGGSHAEELLAAGPPPVGPPFGAPEEQAWRWRRAVTRSSLTALVHSRSRVITAGDEERSRIGREASALFDEIGAVGDAVVELPYVTRAYRVVRPRHLSPEEGR